MITRKDVNKELAEARKVVSSDAKVEEKLKALAKLVEVTIKVNLGIRSNVVKVMEKLGVEKVQPRRPKENAEKTETKE